MEVIISIGLTSILLITLIALENFVRSSQTLLTNNSQSYNEASIAVDSVTKELRNAKPAATGSYPLELADDQQIIFYANIDEDIFPERIRYRLQDNQLIRGVIQPLGNPPTYPLIEEKISLIIPDVQNNTNPVFTYYNGDWPADTTNNPLPAPARLTDTKYVIVSITINPEVNRAESAYTLTSSAQIRSLKTNL